MLGLVPPFLTTFAALLALMPWPVSAQALDTLCKHSDRPAERANARSLRETTSRFAPRLEVRIWFEPGDDRRWREQTRPSALAFAPGPTPTPHPTQHNAKVREPIGWQLTVRWDLVEMAEAVRPGLLGSSTQPMPTECLGTQSMARQLLLEDGPLEKESSEDDSYEEGDE